MTHITLHNRKHQIVSKMPPDFVERASHTHEAAIAHQVGVQVSTVRNWALKMGVDLLKQCPECDVVMTLSMFGPNRKICPQCRAVYESARRAPLNAVPDFPMPMLATIRNLIDVDDRLEYYHGMSWGVTDV